MEGNTRIGYASIYTYSGSKWRQLGGDITGQDHGDHAGSAVSLSDCTEPSECTVLVGSAGSRGSASSWSARVYDLIDDEWRIRGDRGMVGDSASFGTSARPIFSAIISGSGKTVAVGSAKNDEAGIDAGKTVMYEYTISY